MLLDVFSVDTKNKMLQVVYHADVVMTGKYKAAGQLLVLPISGDGDMMFDLSK